MGVKKRVRTKAYCDVIMIVDEDAQGNLDCDEVSEILSVDEFEIDHEID